MQPLSNGGVVTWVLRGSGRIASHVCAMNMLLYQLVDLATYPSLVAPYMEFGPFRSISWIGPILVLALGLIVNLRHVTFASDILLV